MCSFCEVHGTPRDSHERFSENLPAEVKGLKKTQEDNGKKRTEENPPLDKDYLSERIHQKIILDIQEV